jgi:hypothetical protein
MDCYKTHHSDPGDSLRAAKYWEEAGTVAVSLGNTHESVSVEESFLWKFSYSQTYLGNRDLAAFGGCLLFCV